jgi:hypothetical protein
MEASQYPLTFVDYNFMVPSPGVIIFDAELDPNMLCVKDGDKFEVRITNGRITFRGIERKKD